MSASEQKQPVVVSREELYAQVWASPMSHLAARYGITGTGLAKICARLDVPCPPRGYWAKKATGKPVAQYRLPQAKADTPLKVTITPAPPAPTPSPAQTEREQHIAVAWEAHVALVVPDRLNRPHRVIANWLDEYKRKVQEAKRERDPWHRQLMAPTPFTEMDRRRHRFLDALFKALEPLGFAIKEEPYQRVYLEIQKERVDFQLREKQKQVRRPLTEEEKERSWHRNRGWVQELQPSGILVFSIKTYLADGMKQEWKDEPEKPLEACLPDIVATVSLAGPI